MNEVRQVDPPRKTRAFTKLGRLTTTQQALLEGWLTRENLTYVAAARRVSEQFGLRMAISTLGKFYQARMATKLFQRAGAVRLELTIPANPSEPLRLQVLREGAVNAEIKVERTRPCPG